MPTRIVLDVSDKRPPPLVTPGGRFQEKKKKTKRQHIGDDRHDRNSKRVIGFRSHLIRPMYSTEGEEEEEDDETQYHRHASQQRGLSTSDLRASPRLIGYIYQLLASVVLLISCVAFWSEEELGPIEIKKIWENRQGDIYYSVAGPVSIWKLTGSMAVGPTGMGITLAICLAHFDTVCFPRFWVAIFSDGSKCEQYLLLFMILFWAFGLHICTSSLSVGEVQGNVFFTTWIAFAASAMNYGVWRTSAGLESLAEKISTHHRETTYNWLWLLLCISIFAGAGTDMFFNKDELNFQFGKNRTPFTEQAWKIALAMVWGFLGLGIVSVALNHYLTQSLDLRCGDHCRIVVGWRHIEGLIIICMVVVFFFLLIEHSGANGVVNGFSNSYFSLWGAFFNAVFLLGTWLRENKNILREDHPKRGNRRVMLAP